MDLINDIKWIDNNGVQSAEASFEIMELYISNPELFKQNNIVMDQYGVLKRNDDLRLHTENEETSNIEASTVSNDAFDADPYVNDLESSNDAFETSFDGSNDNIEEADPPLNAKKHIDDEHVVRTGMGNLKIEKNLSNNAKFLKNPKKGPPEKSEFDRPIQTNQAIGWTDTPLTVKEDPVAHKDALDALHKFLKEEDSENKENIDDMEKIITEEEIEIIKNTKLRYKDELLEYQINHVKKLVSALRNNQTAFDGSETGTGKTHSALVTAKNLDYNVVVICPKPVIYTWYDAMKLHRFKVCHTKEESKNSKRWGFVSNYEQFKNGNTPFLKAKMVDGDMVFRWDKFPKNTLLVVDEIQKAKNAKTQNAELLYQARNAGVSILMLSATAVDKVEFMYTLGFMLDLYRSIVHYKQWTRTKKIEAPSGIIPEKHCMILLHKHIFPKRGSRMTIKDAGDSFPKNYVIWEPYINKKIKEVLVLFEKRIKKIMKAKGESECMLTAILRARQETELLKVPIFIEMTKDLVAEGKSVAIFLNFKESIELVAMAFEEKEYSIIWGDNTAEEREKNRLRFVNNKQKIIICNIASGGVGISLHDTSEGGKHPRVSLINPTWSAQDIKQTLGRIFRSGATSKCIQKIIYAPGTVEEKLMAVVKFKLNNIETLNDGPVNILKEVLGLAKPAANKPAKKPAKKHEKKKSKKNDSESSSESSSNAWDSESDSELESELESDSSSGSCFESDSESSSKTSSGHQKKKHTKKKHKKVDDKNTKNKKVENILKKENNIID